MRVSVWPALGSACQVTSTRWAQHSWAIKSIDSQTPQASIRQDVCGRPYGRCMATAIGSPHPHKLDQRFEWLGEALRLVRESSSTDHPLVKEQLWEVCGSKEWCTIPSKTVLGDTLNWLKEQKAVKTAKSAEVGSKKHPRFAYYAPVADPSSKVLKPTDEIAAKWARACHQQHDGHRRALMLSTQAVSLAKLTCDAAPETHPSMKDPWLAERGGPAQSASPRLPDKREQITRRLKKLVYIAGLARMKHEYRAKLAGTALEMMDLMEEPAAKGLKGQLLRDYNSHMKKLRHDMRTRQKGHEAALQQQRTAEEKYQGWLSKLKAAEDGGLSNLEAGVRPWWQHVFAETAREAPGHAAQPEADMVRVERILKAEEKVAQVAWEGSKSEKRAEYMRKVAKSDAERAYAERMISRAQENTAHAERLAQQEVAHAGGGVAARAQQAQKRLRQEGKAWYHQEVAQGELRALQRLEREIAQTGTTKKNRVSEAAAKREALRGMGSGKELLFRAKKRWQRTGLSLEPYRKPQRPARAA